MPDPFTTAGADYLEQLLRAAIDVPAAAADPASGRIVANLMVALGAKREDERLEPFLSCWPGRRSVHEVTCYDEVDRPASRITNLAAGQAIRAATGFASTRPDHTVVVVARDDNGDERCVLVARGPDACYQFPDLPAVEGGAPSPPAQEAQPSPPAQEAQPSPPAQEAQPSPGEGTASNWRPDSTDAPWVALTERLESLPTTDEVVTALHDVLGGMTTDLRNQLGSLPTADEVISAIRDLLGGMTIELDATALEDVIHAALDELPHLTAASVTPTTTEGPEVAAPTANTVVEMAGDGPALPEGSVAGHTAAIRSGVSIDAERVADRVSGELLEHEDDRAGLPQAPNPTAISLRVIRSPRVTTRAPSDRSIDDALALVALSSRHR